MFVFPPKSAQPLPEVEALLARLREAAEAVELREACLTRAFPSFCALSLPLRF